MSSIGSSLSSVAETLADLTKKLHEKDTKKVATFQAYVQDVPKEKIKDARYIGDMRPNQNRLNVFSLATNTDTQDYYRFNLKFGGNIHLNMLTDSLDGQRRVVESETAKGLGIQMLQYHGASATVIADSDPKSGSLNELYKNLSGKGARLTAGKYVVRVYRLQDTPPNQEFFYSFQVTGDRYQQDYDTMQREAPKHPKTKSVFEMMTVNPAVIMLAANMDPTLSVQMGAATRGTKLNTTVQEGVDPRTQLLDAFM